MALEYGISSKGKPIVLYRNFEYVTDKENVRGTIAWRCRYHQTMKCKARLTTSGDREISSRDPGHNHTGNVSIARARQAVGEMKNKITDLTVTPSSSQAAVMSQLPDDTLMALPRRATDFNQVLVYVIICLRLALELQ